MLTQKHTLPHMYVRSWQFNPAKFLRNKTILLYVVCSGKIEHRRIHNKPNKGKDTYSYYKNSIYNNITTKNEFLLSKCYKSG